jgi:poly(A) polymerase
MTDLEEKIFKIVSQESEMLGVKSYIVGGYVRDTLLERKTNDIDIVVEGSGLKLAEMVGARFKTKVNYFPKFGTAMLRINHIEVEFVGARKESYRSDSRNPIVEDGTIEEDRMRRDFTINAISFSLNKENFGALIDPLHGEKDLHHKLIRTPLDPDTTYSDDPLRMIRAIRFATQLNFSIVPESLESIKKNCRRIEILSMERICDELNKIMASTTPSIGFLLLDQTAILDILIPELSALKGVEMVEGRGHKDNFLHSLQVLDNVAAKSDNLWLRWGALLHDIGKGQTKKYEQGVGWSFHNHDFIGGRMVKKVFTNLALPTTDKLKYVSKLVSLHLRPIALVEEDVTDSAVRRLLYDAGDDIDDLMLLCEADITSKNDKTVTKHKNNFAKVRQKLIDVEERDKVRNFKNPITGEMIMEYYSIPPSENIGIIKEYIKNAILDGVIPNERDSAFQLMLKKGEELGLNGASHREDL